MTVIYDFASYRIPRVLESCAQQMGDVAAEIYGQEELLHTLEARLVEAEEKLNETGYRLRDANSALVKSKSLHAACFEAIKGGHLDDMFRVRDAIYTQRKSKLRN